MPLTIAQVCERLAWSRSTVLRALADGSLEGSKRHACGGECLEPVTCKQGRWEISEDSVAKYATPERRAS